MAIVLAMKFIFLFFNLAKIHVLFLNVPSKGGSTDLGNIPKKKNNFLRPFLKHIAGKGNYLS